MDTGIYTPKDLFQQAISYIIPPFQRSYVWDEEEQWEPLWADIRNTAEAYLEKVADSAGDVQAEQETRPHFLGAVVLQQEQTSTREISKRIIVDGQQRITTLQLLIDATRIIARNFNLKPATRLLRLVQNDDRDYEGNELFKLWPAMNDRDAFQHAMVDDLSIEGYQESKIVQAHEFFLKQVEDWIGYDDREERMAALEVAIASRMQLVVIDLDTQSDPYIIFETLNARGTPLLASDLIKNYVLSRTHDEPIRAELGDAWWRIEIRQGRLYRGRIEVALNYWLTMRSAKEILASHVFDEFKHYADPKNVTDVMGDVNLVLSKYRDFQNSDSLQSEEKVFRSRLDTMRMGVVTPILLLLLSSPAVSTTKRIRAFNALASFLVRRMVCRATAKDYNSMMLSLLLELRKHGESSFDEVIVNFLREQQADAREWPTDARVRQTLSHIGLYRLLTRSRLRLVLEGIEAELRRSSMSEQVDVPTGLSIEHIMPQGWRTYWPLPNEDQNREEVTSERDNLINTLGNLTLVNQRLNSSLSNAPWEQKRGTIQAHSNMSLNSELLTASHDELWNEQAIQERSKRLADVFVKVWPGPDSPVWNE